MFWIQNKLKQKYIHLSVMLNYIDNHRSPKIHERKDMLLLHFPFKYVVEVININVISHLVQMEQNNYRKRYLRMS